MVKIKEIIEELEKLAPPAYQESYDNSGLITGDKNWEVSGVMVSLDCIESVIDDAIDKKCNLIVAHHPIVFKGLKKLNGKSYVERTIIKAIKNDIGIYAIHTNLDNVYLGVNQKMANQIGLVNTRILAPKKQLLEKLVVFIPKEETNIVLEALHAIGAGEIGNYSHCSFKVNGTGSFKPNENANPVIGERGQLEHVNEDRVEIMYPSHLSRKVIHALKENHPYEEVAYYISQLENENQEVGAGMIGQLKKEMTSHEFLSHLKQSMGLSSIRYTAKNVDSIKIVALCGGAGSFLLASAMAQNADAFVTGDFKYHEFFDGEGKTMIADIGHYESEKFTKELLHSLLTEKFANIATYLTEVNTNPVLYF
ncbi:Nif3-like dinuclear metal center hexameric protein [Roseivirga echinicomitans]|uniref:GTP cyclohydrolase 1 type 2 homolog n=1 Tax=Roseivirga echinicomitans TaxID=296218 RepID=A0A150X2I5_9BACT|nr:Nif3-like dinuclear metal center hexameric protein [Roseivirga echinicomitans]KYG72928.1 NGG1p interacting factor NIF3 [Roseivirga echinicomitans]